jgi:ankyrin repeat protein
MWPRDSRSSLIALIVWFIGNSCIVGSEASAGELPPLDIAVLNLDVAASNGDIRAIGEALAAGTKVDALSSTGQTALYFAAFAGKTEAVKLLLDKGADVNGGQPGGLSGTPFQAALLSNQYEIAKILLKDGKPPIDVHAKTLSLPTTTLLATVVDTKDADLLKVFLDHAVGIDPNEQMPIVGWTALDSAILNRQNDLAAILLTKLRGWHFTPNAITGQTTLDFAIQNGTPELVALILDKVPGLDLSTKNKFGQSVLDSAADKPEILRVLVAHLKKQ